MGRHLPHRSAVRHSIAIWQIHIRIIVAASPWGWPALSLQLLRIREWSVQPGWALPLQLLRLRGNAWRMVVWAICLSQCSGGQQFQRISILAHCVYLPATLAALCKLWITGYVRHLVLAAGYRAWVKLHQSAILQSAC